MTTKFKKGFTLIELLVVIAIIGILSSIVLGSLSSARTKGEDTAIQAGLSNMRAQADLYYSNNSHYGTQSTGACNGATTLFATTTPAGGTGSLKGMVDEVTSKAGYAFCSASGGQSGGAAAWMVYAPLKGSTGSQWCVDSVGNSKKIGTAGGGVATTTTTSCN